MSSEAKQISIKTFRNVQFPQHLPGPQDYIGLRNFYPFVYRREKQQDEVHVNNVSYNNDDGESYNPLDDEDTQKSKKSNVPIPGRPIGTITSCSAELQPGWNTEPLLAVAYLLQRSMLVHTPTFNEIQIALLNGMSYFLFSWALNRWNTQTHTYNLSSRHDSNQ